MKLTIFLLLKLYLVLCYQTISKKPQKQKMDCNKKDKSKEQIYTKVCIKKLVLTAKVVKSIKTKRKRKSNCNDVSDLKKMNFSCDT